MSESSSFEVVATRSGVPAMRDRVTGEIMHPLAGPLEESVKLYIGPSRLAERLLAAHSEPLVLLDVGLGAGSNAAAAWALSESRAGATSALHIVSFDRTLAAFELAFDAENRSAFGFAGSTETACAALIEHGVAEGVHTHWRVSLGELPGTLSTEPESIADVVFWDPFSPRSNPDLWSAAAFSALRRVCRDGATVHTYSGATATRTALLLAGFAVGFGDVLASGRQATIAATRAEDLVEPLDRRWLERLSRSSAPFPSDAPGDAFERIARSSQFV